MVYFKNVIPSFTSVACSRSSSTLYVFFCSFILIETPQDLILSSKFFLYFSGTVISVRITKVNSILTSWVSAICFSFLNFKNGYVGRYKVFLSYSNIWLVTSMPSILSCFFFFSLRWQLSHIKNKSRSDWSDKYFLPHLSFLHLFSNPSSFF